MVIGIENALGVADGDRNAAKGEFFAQVVRPFAVFYLTSIFDRESEVKVSDVQVSELDISVIADEINREHELVIKAFHDGFKSALRIGELLNGVKDKVKHGELRDWIEANCSFGVRQAQRYMKLWNEREVIEKAKVKSLLTNSSFSIEKALELAFMYRFRERKEKFQEKLEASCDPLKRFNGEHPHAVKEFTDAIFAFRDAVKLGMKAYEFEKFSPEAISFTRRKIDNLIEILGDFRGRLEEREETERMIK